MDNLQGSTGASEKQPEKPADQAGWQHTPSEAKPEAKPALKMPVNLPKFNLKFKMPEGGFMQWLKSKFSEYKRVYSITKKPDKAEFTATVKAAGLGIIVIGVVGFIITMIVQLLGML